MGRYAAAVVTKGVSAAALFGSHVALSRLAGSVDHYGTFSYALSLAGVLGLVGVWGLDRSLVRLVSLGHQLRPAAVATALAFASIVAVFGVTAFVAIARVDMLTPAWIGAIAMIVVGTAASRSFAAVLRGIDRTVTSEAILQVGRPALLLLGLGGGVALGLRSLDGLSMAMLFGASHLLTALLLLAGLVVWASGIFAGPPDAEPGHRPAALLRLSTPFLLSGMALPLLANVDILIIGQFLPDADVALYAAGVRVVSVAAMGLLAVGILLSARIAPLVRERNRGELQRLLRENMGVTLAVSAPLVGALLVFGEHALALFGEEYRAGFPAMLVLLIAQLVNVLSGPVHLVATLSLPQRSIVLSAVVAVLLLAVVSVIAVPTLGIAGGALGHAVGLTTFNLLLLRSIRGALVVDPSALALLPGRHRPAP